MRASGILLPVSSLPSPYGIGTLGKQAIRFIDFLKKAGQTYWQILPIGPTSYGDSPYQSFSTFAGNPYFVDLELLREHGLLHESDYAKIDWGQDKHSVDYDTLYQHRFRVLKKAYVNYLAGETAQMLLFRKKNAVWIEDYALFMALKEHFGQVEWTKWEENIRKRTPDAVAKYRKKLENECGFWVFVQFVFFHQWFSLREYAERKGVKVIGDIPIYVAQDSADVWAHPELFQLDEEGCPLRVAGCPPDAFCSTGQLWGNPLYNWEEMEKRDYDWWIARIASALRVYDVVRIDHFRGFDSYYSIPARDETAENGEWCEGPGMKLFEKVKEELGDAAIIAEDLGFLTDSVKKLLKDSGYPGMKVLQFAFDSREESDYLPHNYDKNCVVYTGTHDNDTAAGWFHTAPKADIRFCRKYLHIRKKESKQDPGWVLIQAAWSSVGNTAIAQMQDLLGLGSEARMNIPSTTGANWRWRMDEKAITTELSKKIKKLTKLYGRKV